MTLVIGKIKENSIRFVSDSKITDEFEVRNNPLLGNLKTFILNPKTCLSFSGNTYFAEKFLDEFYSNKIQNFQHLLIRCLQLNNESNDETFFCLGTLFNNKPELYKIYNRKIENNIKNVWIGDKIGFTKYQEIYLTNNKSDSEFSKMEEAFSAVISDEKIPSVSDFQISVETDFCEEANSSFFIYSFKTIMNVAPHSFTTKLENGKEVIIPMMHGDADVGSFGMSYLRSIEYFKPAIGIHFPQGKFGVLFCPMLNRNKAIVLKNQVDGEDFVNEVKKTYNISLQGLVAKDGNSFKNVVG